MSKVIHDLVLLENQELSRFYRGLVFRAPESLPACVPGQFAELEVPPTHQVFLRRPFSIHAVDYSRNTISFLIKIVGEGTKKLGALAPGTVVSTIYPLGKGFSLPQEGPVLLVGGGCGIAPLLFLSITLSGHGIAHDCLLGGRNSEDIIEAERFRGRLHLTTEDGSSGIRGMVSDHPVFSDMKPYTRIFACGPEGMLRAVALQAFRDEVPCEVSLENTMACGIGVCLCCVVPTTTGNQCVCTEGPVFLTNELKGWQKPGTVEDSCPVI